MLPRETNPVRVRPEAITRSLGLGILALTAVCLGWLLAPGDTVDPGGADPVGAGTVDRDTPPRSSNAGAPARTRLAGSPVAAADVADIEPPRRLRPGSERAHYAELEGLAARDVAEFRRVVADGLAGALPLARAVAGMRVWYDRGVEPKHEPFEQALARGEVRGELGDFALRFLTEKGRRHPEARAALGRYLDGGGQCVRYRTEALFTVLRYGTAAELRGRIPGMYREQEASVLVRGLEGLRLNDVAEAKWIRLELQGRRPTLLDPDRGR